MKSCCYFYQSTSAKKEKISEDVENVKRKYCRVNSEDCSERKLLGQLLTKRSCLFTEEFKELKEKFPNKISSAECGWHEDAHRINVSE